MRINLSNVRRVISPFSPSQRHSYRWRKYSQTCNSEEEDLDLTRFGDYELVLTEDPTREGVAHVEMQSVPNTIARPYYVPNGTKYFKPFDVGVLKAADSIIKLSSPEEQSLRKASTLAAEALRGVSSIIVPGVTTSEIDQTIHNFIISQNAYPSTLGYNGYPKSCCTSVNNVICHGIPDNRALVDGDIVNVDVTAYFDGYHGDTSVTFPVGEVDQQGIDLIGCTEEALHSAIRICGPGVPFRQIGGTIQRLAQLHGFSVSSEFTGHGIGRLFHQKPDIKHYVNNDTQLMQPGHCFTIEPSLIQGEDARGWILPDGWTCLTESGARSAQFEHTILITENGVEVLTS